MTDTIPPRQSHTLGLRLIASFKLIVSLLLTVTGFGIIRLFNADLAEGVRHLAAILRFDPHNGYVDQLLGFVSGISRVELQILDAGTFFYAALHLVEGLGLWFKKRWAEYLTVIATFSLIPFECYEIWHKTTLPRIAVLTINLFILIYLVRLLLHKRKREQIKAPITTGY
jgi:uncharacterized membrane protein (DUF2068 family)